MILSPAEIEAMRSRAEGAHQPNGLRASAWDVLCTDVPALIESHEALRAENARLTSQVAAYREAVEGALEFGDRYLTEHERELCRLGDDTEAAALEAQP